jgi:uncharacterized repeat protein (TIGR02543 family)
MKKISGRSMGSRGRRFRMKSKRFWASLLTLAMTFILLPTAAFAAGSQTDLQAVLDGAADGATVALTDDYVLSGSVNIPAGRTLTIDGAGKTLKRASGYTGKLLDVSGTLMLTNAAVDGGANWGTAASLDNTTANSGLTAADVCILVNKGGSLTLSDGCAVQNNDKNTASAPSEYGSAVLVLSGGSLIIDGGSIQWNRIFDSDSVIGYCGGAAVYAASGADDTSVEIKSGALSHNAVYCAQDFGAAGGAVLLESFGTGKLTCTMSGGTIDHNFSSYEAAGIKLSGNKASFALSDGEISYNLAAVESAVNVNSHSAMTMTGGKIGSNTATAAVSSGALGFGGGTVGVTSGSTFDMSAGEICQNTSNGSAGALDIYGKSSTTDLSTATLSGTASVHDNTALCQSNPNNTNYHRGGGAVVVHGDGILNIKDNAVLRDNTADVTTILSGYSGTAASCGGGILMLYEGSFPNNTGATVNMSGGKITGNSAMYGGGVAMQTLGVISTASDELRFNMTGGEISGNSSASAASAKTRYSSGGGIYSRIGIVTISGGAVNGNTAYGTFSGGGGGMYLDYGATLNMTGGVISGNTSALAGGGIYANNNGGSGTAYGYVYIKDTEIKNNTAGGSGYRMDTTDAGGGIFANAKATYISGNTKITGNKAQYGGGINAYSYPVYLLSGTVSGNTATSGSGSAAFVNAGLFCLDGTAVSAAGDFYLNPNRSITLVQGAASSFSLATDKTTDSPDGRVVVIPLEQYYNAFTYDGTTYDLTDAEPYVSKFTHNVKAVVTGTQYDALTGNTGNETYLVLYGYHVSFDANLPAGAASSAAFGTLLRIEDALIYDTDFPADPAVDTPAGAYSFGGWYYDAACTRAFQKGDPMPGHDVTLYARWIGAHTVIFDKGANGAFDNASDPLISQSVQDGASAADTPALTPNGGYAFLGWKNSLDNAIYDSDAVKAYKVTADVTFTAQYARSDKAAVVFDYAGGQDGAGASFSTVSGYPGDAYTAPTPARTGYTFDGWDAAPALTFGAAGSVTTYTAKWKPAANTVTYAADAHCAVPAPESEQVETGKSPANVPAVTADAGYSATGYWQCSLGGVYTTAELSNYVVTADVTFTALSAENGKACVLFDYNGGTLGTDVGSHITGASGSSIAAADVPDYASLQRTGYTCTGWNAAPAAVYGAAGSVTVYTAQWAIDTHTLSFDANGGTTAAADVTRDYGSNYSIKETAVPASAAEEFIGWFDAVSGGSAVTIWDAKADMTVYAHYQARAAYTVTFDKGARGTMKPDPDAERVFAGGFVTGVPAVTPAGGYTFLGWTLPGSTTKYSDADVLAMKIGADTVFTAAYQQTTTGGGGGGSTYYYALTFELNGGSAVSSITKVSGTVIPLTQTTTRSDYTFAGWYSDAALTAKVTSVTLNGNMTVYAKWTKNGEGTIDWNKTDHFAYIIGYTDGLVHPEANITRGETVTIFFRLMTDASRNTYWKTTNTFSDVTSADWYNNAASTMENANFVKGYPDGTFGGSKPITRAEFAVIAARANGADGKYTGSDKFSDTSGHWAEGYINEAAEMGLIAGYSDGTFQPDAYITRAEAMTLVNRFLGRDKVDSTSLLSGMATWPDNADKTAWYYYAVQEATNSHDFTRQSNNYETWTKLTAVRDWAALEKSWSTANSGK